jgi:hypothetical protein
MFSKLMKAAVLRRAGLVSGCIALTVVTQFSGAGKAPLRNLKLDPTAGKVELFAGMEGGSLSTRMIADDIHGGNLFIENKTNKPLTVLMPPAFVGVHVLKQMGGMMGGMGGGMGGMGGGMGGMGGGMGGGGMGGGQGMGGGMGGGGMGGMGGGMGGMGGGMGGMGGGMGGMGGMGGGGGGFFSIPPFKVAQVPFQSVCLNHGRPDPMPQMTYRIMKLEDYTDNRVLQQTVRMYGTGQMDYPAAQAATWHLTDNKSLSELASMAKYGIEGDETTKEPIFSQNELRQAQEVLAIAKKQAAELEKTEVKKPTPVKKQSPTGRPERKITTK